MKVGIFGGSFDPIHNDHCSIIDQVFAQLKLDKIVLVPSYNPPHKDHYQTAFADRVSMLETIYNNDDRIVIDTLESEMGLENSYSYIVLDILKSFYGENLYFIIGGDSLIEFHNWKMPDIIAKQAKLVVVKRDSYLGFNEALLLVKQKYNAEIIEVSFSGSNISSSILRAKLELLDDSALNDIPEPAYRYIINNKLYMNYKEIINKLKESVSSSTFEHSKRTVLFAMKYMRKLKLDFNKVFLSALLHDNAKEIEVDVEKCQLLKTTPNVFHQFLGADLVKIEYGISDQDIINAIKVHTTGKANMNELEKLIYVSDKLEEGRYYPGVDRLRKLLNIDFNQGFVELVKMNLKYIQTNKNNIDERTLATYLYYCS